jgi:hypothetical protein
VPDVAVPFAVAMLYLTGTVLAADNCTLKVMVRVRLSPSSSTTSAIETDRAAATAGRNRHLLAGRSARPPLSVTVSCTV